MHLCSRCGIGKRFDEFSPSKRKAGRKSWCKECCRQLMNKRYAQDEAYRTRAIAAATSRNKRADVAEARRLDVRYILRSRMATRLRCALRDGKMGRRTADLVGYSVEELANHIERQFTRGMTWKNMGDWHIDHIVPLAAFSFASADDAEFKQAWALTNLRPLWAKDNLKKRDSRTHLI